MQKTKKFSRIRYVVALKNDGDFVDPQSRYKSVAATYIKRYYNSIRITFPLETASRNLLEWILERMNDSNFISHSEYTRREFIRDYKEITGLQYSDQTVKAAFQKLHTQGVLLSIRRGLFQVNPEYFFKGDERERESQIKKMLELNSGIII